MVRRRTQRGRLNQRGGLNQQGGIQNESYMDALKREYVFFYYKLKGLEVPKEKRFVELEQEEEVKRVLLEAKRKGMDQDDIIRTIFHAEPVKFQQELSDWEEYKPSGFLNQGTAYERRAFPIAKSLDRFIGTIQSTPKQLQYKSDFMVSICESSNFEELVVSLDDKYCITVLTNEMKEQFEDNKGSAYPVSYIVVKKDFFPPRVSISGGPITLKAKAIPAVSFLIDAFQQDGIVEIEPTLYTTLQREAPELLRFSLQHPIILVSPEFLSNATTTKDRFIIIDTSILTRGRNVIQMSNIPSKPLLKEAFTQQKVYFMDPKTMYEIRTQFPALWKANYGTTDSTVFESLTPNEKLVFCFLQFKKMEELYSLSQTVAALQEAKETVFGGMNVYELADNFQIEDEENLRQMIKLQETVLGTVEIRTPDEIRYLLRRFDPTALQQTRKEIVKQAYPADILEKRKTLLKDYQNALAAPVSSSKIPSFLRTRKAKNSNRNQWKQRVQIAKAALLNYNKTHKLPFSKGANKYNI